MRAIKLGIGVGWEHKIFQFDTNLANRGMWQLKTKVVVTLEGLF